MATKSVGQAERRPEDQQGDAPSIERTMPLSFQHRDLAVMALVEIGDIANHLVQFVNGEPIARTLLARIDTLSVVTIECLEDVQLSRLSLLASIVKCQLEARHLRPEVSHG